MHGKEYVLRPMSPSQVIAEKQATNHGKTSEKVTQPKVSESHKPNLSASSPREKNLILFATKSEIRGVCENPSSVLHYVLLCKDNATQSKNSHALPLVLSSLLQEFQDVFVTPSMRLYLPRVEARLRGITTLKAMSQVR